MLQAERYQFILQKIEKEHSVRIKDLCKELNVTRQTIRKDIEYLETINKLKKVHGGAILPKKMTEPPFTSRNDFNLLEKEAIAIKAAGYVERGDTIFLDIGTTINRMVDYLIAIPDLTVITNSIYVAYHLGYSDHTRIILTGGEMRNKERSLSGLTTIQNLQQYYVDKAFFGVGGFSIKAGYTDYHIGEADVRRLMINRANTSFALMDYSKYDIVAVTQFANVGDMEVVITDEKAPENAIEYLKKQGVTIDKVKVKER